MTSTADPWAEPTPGNEAPPTADGAPAPDAQPKTTKDPTLGADEAPKPTAAERRAARKAAAAARAAAGAGAVPDEATPATTEEPADPEPEAPLTGVVDPPVEPEPTPGDSEPKPPAKKSAAKKAAAPPPSGVGHGLLSGSLADQVTILSMLLYGPEGTGKTTDALRMTQLCEDHQRVVLVDAEAGAKIKALRQRGIDVAKIIPWPTPEEGGPSKVNYDGLSELSDQIEAANADRRVIIGVVWDSGTEITKRILDQVVEMGEEKDRRLGKARAPFQINLEDHGVASSMLRALLRRYRDLGVHLVITALERRDQDPDTGKIKYGPAMSPAMANDAAGLVDIVGYTMVEEVGESATEVRSARFVPIERRRAKDRYGLLPPKMPDPYFDRIFGYIEGTLDRDNDPVRARVIALATGSPPDQPSAQAVADSAAAAAS